MKIAPSLMCMDLLKFKEQIEFIDQHADYFHIDIMDGHFVPNLTLSPFFVSQVKKLASKPLDCHLMVTRPQDYISQLAQAGADIIAFDGTDRPRPVGVKAMIDRIHQRGCAAMADCSNLEDGTECHNLGADIIGTTMSGYTTDAVPTEPDFPLVQALSAKGYRVIAEGRFNSPALAALAIKHGAWAVTVGSAITRIEHICQWYRDALAEVAL
ncbi:hypothetical protein ACS0TW_02525 [Klebsiella michiganensis]